MTRRYTYISVFALLHTGCARATQAPVEADSDAGSEVSPSSSRSGSSPGRVLIDQNEIYPMRVGDRQPTLPPTLGRAPARTLTSEDVADARRLGEALVNRRCGQENFPSEGATSVVYLEIGADGGVLEASAEGKDNVLNRCLEKQLRTWSFPPRDVGTQVVLPFTFARP